MQSVVSPIFEAEITGSSPSTSASTPASIRHPIEISFDDLSEFEIVQNQYSAFGVRFYNAIALQPTNLSFRIDRMGVMPMGNAMKLTIAFDIPPQQVRLILTGASLIHATLLNREHHPISNPTSQPISRPPLLPAQAALPPSASRRSSPNPNSTVEPFAFPQYELNFAAVPSCPEESSTLRSKNVQLYPTQLHQIELQSASPFVLGQLTIELEGWAIG